MMANNPYVHAIVMSDTEGFIRYWNDNTERLFGYSAAEAEGQSIDFIVLREYCERHWKEFRQAMWTNECKLDRAATSLLIMCKDGTVGPVPPSCGKVSSLRIRWS